MDVFHMASEQIDAQLEQKLNSSKICETQFARETIRRWKEQGCIAVALSGGFDLLTLNHIRGLVQARFLAAAYALDIDPSEQISQRELTEIRVVASSDSLKLLVSIDTNMAIKQAKGQNPNKGSADRPLLDWATRARIISTLAMPATDGSNNAHAIADCITAHGKTACPVHKQCLVTQPDYEVFNLDPDVTIMKDKYDAGNRPRHYKDPSIILFDESCGSYVDPLLDGQISTTAIVRRIRNA